MRLSTLHLKILTSGMLALCFALVVGWPFILGPRPGRTASLAENKAYAVKFVAYLGVDVLLLILAGVGAIIIMRRASAEYRIEQMNNMRDLIEATLIEDQKKANGNAPVE